MSDESINSLEQKIDHLIALSERLKQENLALRQRETVLVRDRNRLLEKNDLARARVESMIARLKNLGTEG